MIFFWGLPALWELKSLCAGNSKMTSWGTETRGEAVKMPSTLSGCHFWQGIQAFWQEGCTSGCTERLAVVTSALEHTHSFLFCSGSFPLGFQRCKITHTETGCPWKERMSYFWKAFFHIMSAILFYKPWFLLYFISYLDSNFTHPWELLFPLLRLIFLVIYFPHHL